MGFLSQWKIILLTPIFPVFNRAKEMEVLNVQMARLRITAGGNELLQHIKSNCTYFIIIYFFF